MLLYVDLTKVPPVFFRLRHDPSACRDKPTPSCRHFRKCRLCRFSNRGHLLTSSQVHRLRVGLSRGGTSNQREKRRGRTDGRCRVDGMSQTGQRRRGANINYRRDKATEAAHEQHSVDD